MRAIVQFTATLGVVAVLCHASTASAEDAKWMFTGNQPAQTEAAPAATQPAPGSCCDLGCADCTEGCKTFGGCDCDPEMGIVASFGLDSFKGVSDGSNLSNFGVMTGINTGVPMAWLDQYGLGWQTGLNYGVYDFDGALSDNPRSQQELFVTTGLFRKGREGQRLSFGLVYDWMFSNQWGIYGTSPTLGQWRGQVEFALSDINAIGVYGCLRDRNDLSASGQRANIETRAISQANLFWHHKFESAADSWLWIGVPERSRLSGDKSLGDWIVGASIQAPLSDRLALYGNAQYMHPSAAAGTDAAIDATWNVGAGIAWYIGGHAVSHSLNGKCWMPYMPVANNSTFLVDQNAVF